MYNSTNPAERHLSPWAYVGYNLLFAIPIVGLILLIVFAVDNNYICRRNYARSYFCMLLIGVVIALVVLVILMATGFSLANMGGYRYR